MRAHILFVDDEPGIRDTLPAILEQHGFQVTVAATVPEALHAITTGKFDVLISDLNIGAAGDGFTVVSAMRRTQPDCVNFILTGYPAFEPHCRPFAARLTIISSNLPTFGTWSTPSSKNWPPRFPAARKTAFALLPSCVSTQRKSSPDRSLA